MAFLASGTHSAAVKCRTSCGTSEALGFTRPLRTNASGRSLRPSSRKLIKKAMAKQDAEGSEQGRLLRDALEFNKPPSESTIKQQPGEAPADPQIEYKAGDMLGNKYRVIEVLGRGKAGVTYKAERPGGGAVAVKALSLRSMADWKQLELFEKEADALRSLSHPGIPAYEDYFEVDSDGDRAYFLVQELIEGKSLAQMVEAGWQPAQKEVERIAHELLTTFSYLQQQQVVHRDVKPENIILEGGKPGGKLLLVDFGGIQQGSKDVADSEVMDTGTLVGTYGYMAPEQLRGSAKPASDLFALGGTLLYLLSGEPPSAYPQRRLKVDFSRVEMSPRLSSLLEGLLQPAYEDRLTATQAKAVLAGQGSARQQQRQQQKAWNPFSQDGWEEARQESKTSSSDRQAGNDDQETASASGRHGHSDQARHRDSGLVAIKGLTVQAMSSWGQLEMLEQEAAMLRNLNHPGIPSCLSTFQCDVDGSEGFFIVQKLVSGRNLQQMLDAGWRPAEQHVERIASEVLALLVYLQQQQVVHGAIEPAHIMLEGGQANGAVSLIGFSRATKVDSQSNARNACISWDAKASSSTSTWGQLYDCRAPEQLAGGARLASDIYGLGCVLLYLLTARATARLARQAFSHPADAGTGPITDSTDTVPRLLHISTR
ncbi:hypothetical protein WJX82_000878 [Trebouxia sp. C0006]